jgi:hypothetical protein
VKTKAREWNLAEILASLRSARRISTMWLRFEFVRYRMAWRAGAIVLISSDCRSVLPLDTVLVGNSADSSAQWVCPKLDGPSSSMVEMEIAGSVGRKLAVMVSAGARVVARSTAAHWLGRLSWCIEYTQCKSV